MQTNQANDFNCQSADIIDSQILNYLENSHINEKMNENPK